MAQVAVIAARGIGVVRDGRDVLADVTLSVEAGEHWALLGPNGAGKSTLLRTLGAWQFPTRGTVELLGHRLGRTDLRELRRCIGWVDPGFDAPAHSSAATVVLTGATATADLLRRDIPAAEQARAAELLQLMGVEPHAGQPFGTLSSGERGRTLIARALLAHPKLLLLDEPFTGLDLPGREGLRPRLTALAAREPNLASVLVTHHLEELPSHTTHAALLRAGLLVAAGPVAEVLAAQPLSDCFGVEVTVEHRWGRWYARAERR